MALDFLKHIFVRRYKLRNGNIRVKIDSLELGDLLEDLGSNTNPVIQLQENADEWTNFETNFCSKEDQRFRIKIEVETNSDQSMVLLDDFGPCHLLYQYNKEQKTCLHYTQVAEDMNINEMASLCQNSAIKGSLLPFDLQDPITHDVLKYHIMNPNNGHLLSGIRRMNGLGHRQFLHDGTYASKIKMEHDHDKYFKPCTSLKQTLIRKPELVMEMNPPTSVEDNIKYPVICRHERPFLDGVKSGSIYSSIQFKILEVESFTMDFGDASEMKYTLDFVCDDNLIKFHSFDFKVDF